MLETDETSVDEFPNPGLRHRLFELWRQAEDDCGAALAAWHHARPGAEAHRRYLAYRAALRHEEHAAEILAEMIARAGSRSPAGDAFDASGGHRGR